MNRRLNYSVKEALDNLPSGICFFNKNGVLTLCNYRMHKVFFELTGKDLQNLTELQELIEGRADGSCRDSDIFLLDDGSAWRFVQEQITVKDGTEYTQIMASDVTELYLRQKELEEDNQKLKEDVERIKQLSANIISLIRDEEILSMKMKVHDDIGRSVIATRQFLQQGKPVAELDLTAWKNAIRLLKHENELLDEQDNVTELMNDAYNLGIKVSIDDNLPEDEVVKEIFLSVIRECMTNAVRHGGAKELHARPMYSDCIASISVSNDGVVPESKPVEGGGLTSLRMLVEKKWWEHGIEN